MFWGCIRTFWKYPGGCIGIFWEYSGDILGYSGAVLGYSGAYGVILVLLPGNIPIQPQIKKFLRQLDQVVHFAFLDSLGNPYHSHYGIPRDPYRGPRENP